jgi:hypothetical protein
MIDRTVLSPYNELVQIDGLRPPKTNIRDSPKNNSPGSNKIITRECKKMEPSRCPKCGELTPTLADKQWHTIMHKYDK